MNLFVVVIRLSTVKHVLIYDINMIHNIRLDPLLTKGLVEIKDFNINYMSQVYDIDLSKVSHSLMNNINIIKMDKNKIILECIGEDPFIELSNSIDFNKISIYTFLKLLQYSILFFILIFIIVQHSVFQDLVLLFILFIYTVYVLIFLSPVLAAHLLILFSLLLLILTLFQRFNNIKNYLKHIFLFISIYSIMGYLSLYLTTEVANENYFYAKIPYIILAIIIPLGFYNLNNFKKISEIKPQILVKEQSN